jgi:hypothetical protein
MKKTFTRRLVAAVAAAGLLLVGAPLVSPAQAAQGCALGATCEGSLKGSLGSTTYKIEMPKKFNGTVVLWNHGYRISTPVPKVLAEAFGYTNSPSYTQISFPPFAPTLGSDVAYIGNGVADVAQNDKIASRLLSQGYALAGTGWSRQGWATPEAVQANELMIKHVRGGAIKGVKKLLLGGESFGSLVAATVAEGNPGAVDGLLPTCGQLSGWQYGLDSAMTVLYTWKSLIAPTLKVANYASYGEALTDLNTVLSLLQKVPADPGMVSPVGYPVAQANLLAGLLAGLPTASAAFDGITVNPAVASLGLQAAAAGGYSPLSAGSSSAAAMLQNVGYSAVLGIMIRYDLEQKARLNAGIPAAQSANITDNVNVSYSRLLTEEQRGEFGDTLNASTVMPNLLNAMLAQLDSTKGDANARFRANPRAVKAINALPGPKGDYVVPTLMTTTTYDPLVFSGNTDLYFKELVASAKKQGKTPVVAQYYTVPPKVPGSDGWTVFQPGAKGVDVAASTANAISGVGHCNWTVGDGVQVVNSVRALSKLVADPSVKGIKAANKVMWHTTLVNRDPFYQPPRLKRANLAR